METTSKISIQVRNLLQLLTKLENATVIKFLQMETSNQNCLYNCILKAIEKAILANDEADFKQLSRILALFGDMNNFPNLTSYFSYDNNPFKMTNVVIMASKHNRIGILSHIFSDNLSIICDLSTKVGRTFPLPTDKDDENHNAFYYAIRSGNIQLLELLMKKWPSNYFSSHLEELCTLLSNNLNELLLKNVDVPIEMNMFINSFLLEYYFKENPPSDSSDYSHDDIQECLFLILEYSELFKTNYKKSESKNLTIFLAKQIALNVMISKKKLKSTYDRIPWEEMEFHLISFIRYLSNQGSFVNCCVTETDFAKYLGIFCECLVQETKEIRNIDIKKLCELPKNVKRSDLVSHIALKYPNFDDFFQNYDLIRDYESLTLIKKYTDVVEEVRALESSGKTVVVRALQVIGENFKNSLESPRLSSVTNDYLMSFLPSKTNSILKNLRDSFSHGFPLSTCQEIEEMYGSEFYVYVQDDIKSLNIGITSVFQKIKLETFKALLKKFCDCEDLEVLKDIFQMIGVLCNKTDISQFFPKNNDVLEIEKLVSDFEKLSKDQTHFEKCLFSKIADIIEDEKIRLRNSEAELQKNLMMLNTYFASKWDPISFNISARKWLIKRQLNSIDTLFKSHGLKNILLLIEEIFNNVASKVGDQDFFKLFSLVSKIYYIIESQEHDVKHLQKLRKTYEKTVKITDQKIRAIKMSPSTCYQDILSDDITALRKIIDKNNFSENNIESYFIYKNNFKLQVEIEMHIMSILSSLEYSNLYLYTSQHSGDDGSPLLIGSYLRKYLAHGNLIVDILMDSKQLIFLYALKIIKHDIYRVKNSTIKHTKNRSIPKTIVEHQVRLFNALSNNSLDEVLHSIKEGADIHGRGSDLTTALHFASKSSNVDIIKLLINRGLNPNVKDIYERNLLHIAASSGCKEIAEYIIEELEISVYEKCNNDQTALHIAAENGCVDVVKILLQHMAATDVTDFSFETPIHKAVINNRLDIVKLLLLNLEDINLVRTDDGFTLFHIAAEGGFLDMVVFLLDKGADVDSVTKDFVTPLHLSSSFGHLEIVKTLISRGANVNAKTTGDVTPLHSAVEFGHLSVVEYLLKHGANINALNLEKRLPLHYAIREKHMNIFKFLLSNGASLEDIAICGDSVYEYAIQNRNLAVVNFLIDNEVPINLRDADGCTPLHLSIYEGSNDISKLLIERGADVSAVDKKGYTPLRHSILRGNTDIARTLLSKKDAFSVNAVNRMTLLHCCAFVSRFSAFLQKEYAMLDVENHYEITSNSDMFDIFQTLVERAFEAMGDRVMDWVQGKERNGRTALHFACISGNLDIVQYLCNKMPHIDIPDKIGYTPLHYAVEFNNVEVVKILISSGKCSLNSMTSEGYTALCLASKNNYTEMAQLLIKNKADVGVGYSYYIAVNGGYQEMCLILLKKRKSQKFEGENDALLKIASFKGLTQVVSYILLKMALSEENSIEQSLVFAIGCGYDDVVTILLDHGADVNFVWGDKHPPLLHLATRRGHTKILKALLDKGADLNEMDSKDSRPIELAVWHGHLDSVKIFFQYEAANVNSKAKCGFTLLHIAAERGHLDIVRLLVQENASLYADNDFGSKPIHIAARHGHLHVVEYFIQCDEKLLIERGCANMTLLHYAAQSGQTEIANHLIKKGIDVNEPGDSGIRPIHLASMFDFEDVLNVLLKNGAIYDCIHDVYHKTPLLFTNNENIKKTLLMIEELFHSVKNNDISNAKLLVEKGACINALDSESMSVLHYAALEENIEIVQLLLKANANLNIIGRKNETPLHYASKYGEFETAKLLLENGAVYNAISTDKKTPFDLALNEDIIDLLKLIDCAFKNVQNCNVQVLSILEKVENTTLIKSVAFSKNSEGQTLMECALFNNFPKLDELKCIIAEKFEIFSQKLFQFMRAEPHTLSDFQKKTSHTEENQSDVLRKYDQTIYYFQNLFKKEEAKLSKADSLRMRSFVGRALYKLGRIHEAIKYFQVVFPKQQELLGIKDSDTLRTLYDMALVLNKLGRHEEALRANNTVFEKYHEMYGSDNPFTLNAQSNVGLTLIKLGEYEEALSVYESVYEKEKKVLGPFHLHTMSSFNNINYILLAQDKHDEALENLQEMLLIQKKSLGPKHIDTLKTENRLGHLLFEMDNFSEANEILRENIGKLKSVLGGEDPLVLQTEQLIENMKLQLDYLNLWRSRDSDKENSIPAFGESLQKELLHLKTVDSEGRTLLQFAVGEGHAFMVKYLLQQKHDVMHANAEGYTALHIAASEGNAEIVELLLSHAKENNNYNRMSAFINAKTNGDGNSALHEAANVETVIALFKYGATYNIQNKDGKTPKEYTEVKEVYDLLQLIEELFVGVSIGDYKVVSKLKNLPFEEILACSNVRNGLKFTLLQLCLKNGHKKLLNELKLILKSEFLLK